MRRRLNGGRGVWGSPSAGCWPWRPAGGACGLAAAPARTAGSRPWPARLSGGGCSGAGAGAAAAGERGAHGTPAGRGAARRVGARDARARGIRGPRGVVVSATSPRAAAPHRWRGGCGAGRPRLGPSRPASRPRVEAGCRAVEHPDPRNRPRPPVHSCSFPSPGLGWVFSVGRFLGRCGEMLPSL